MNQSALAVSTAYETRWTILNGPMKGSAMILQQPAFFIGRSPECEVPIPHDPKCSRQHATVQWRNSACEVTSLNERNLVILNSREVTHAELNDGDVLQIGETELRVNFAPDQSLRLVEHGYPSTSVQTYESPSPFGSPAPQPAAPSRKKSRRRSQKNSGASRFVIYGVIGLLIFWFLNPTGKKKEELKLRTEQQIQADIEAAKKLKELGENEAAKRVDNSVTGRQAQENYVRGFRDYRDGQYSRSLVSFQACLALNPEHALCNRYLRLSQRKFNELIQYHVVLGRKYRDQHQYKACRSAFRNVMVMVKDANTSIYKEAKANYEACNSFVEGRF